LKGGRVVAEGPLESALTAASLGETFEISLELQRVHDRWSARATHGV
jgi:hypothetical protein